MAIHRAEAGSLLVVLFVFPPFGKITQCLVDLANLVAQLFDTLFARARAMTGADGGTTVATTPPPEQALETVHAIDQTAPSGAVPVAEAALPPQTHRIADAARNGATLYRVISEDEATGYLYETLVRADTADEAAAWCASRTRMEIVRVERVSEAPR